MSDLRSSLWLADQLGKKSWAKSGTRLWQKPLYQGAFQARAAIPFLQSFASGILPTLGAVTAPLFLGGSTDQKNRWNRLGYSSEEEYNNAIAAHKADQAANPENYDAQALQYQSEWDANKDEPFLNQVFSNLLNKSQPEEVVETVQNPMDAEKAAWLLDTANSPASQSGAFTDDQRWQQQLKHRDWLANRGGNQEHKIMSPLEQEMSW